MPRSGPPASKPSPGKDPAPPLHRQLRHVAALVGRVRRGQSMTEALPQVPAEWRPGCQALAFHVLRWRGSALAARARLAPRAPAPAVDDLLISALALLWPVGPDAAAPRYAEHTVVDEAVRCARAIEPRSAGFINAVLRQFLRSRDEIAMQAQSTAEGRFNHPDWWVRRLQQDWPLQAEEILLTAQFHPPLVLRASLRHGGLRALTPQLDAAGLPWSRLQWGGQQAEPQAVVLERALGVQAIPGFAQGHWTVQDSAAQRAAPLLLEGLEPDGAQPGRPLRILDACSAPGGKTAHLLDLASPQGLDLLALDADAQRLQRAEQSLQRLGLRARVQAADARNVAAWWDGQPFDAVLLDAPCSASGIVRRHPDARWLKRETDILTLTRVQAELLDALWPLVRSGGRLVYATCSVFKAEGQDQIDAFLQRHRLPATVIDPLSPGHLLPLADNGPNPSEARAAALSAPDGFYYARLHKP